MIKVAAGRAGPAGRSRQQRTAACWPRPVARASRRRQRAAGPRNNGRGNTTAPWRTRTIPHQGPNASRRLEVLPAERRVVGPRWIWKSGTAIGERPAADRRSSSGDASRAAGDETGTVLGMPGATLRSTCGCRRRRRDCGGDVVAAGEVEPVTRHLPFDDPRRLRFRVTLRGRSSSAHPPVRFALAQQVSWPCGQDLDPRCWR